jgi:protein-S-isoprenylcysteine O-methyltransferase Ste14
MAAELSFIWGEALYLANLGVMLYAIAISATAHVMVVHVEEPELLKRFGQTYVEYCRSVPRWFPRLGRRR